MTHPQFATLKTGRGQHRKYLPHAFTEHGAIMAATVLNSPRATEVSVYVVRAFVRLRELLASNKDLERGESDAGPYQSPMEDGMMHFHEYLRRGLAGRV